MEVGRTQRLAGSSCSTEFTNTDFRRFTCGCARKRSPDSGGFRHPEPLPLLVSCPLLTAKFLFSTVLGKDSELSLLLEHQFFLAKMIVILAPPQPPLHALMICVLFNGRLIVLPFAVVLQCSEDVAVDTIFVVYMYYIIYCLYMICTDIFMGHQIHPVT